MHKKCVACGMPMATPEHRAMGDESKDYCVHYARPDGSMQSYEEKLESMSQFIMRQQGLDEPAARNAAASSAFPMPFFWKLPRPFLYP